MQYRSALAWMALSVLLAFGCGKSGEHGAAVDSSDDGAPSVAENAAEADTTALAAKSDGPEGAVYQFLEAVRSGNDAKTEAMFTNLAREKIKELEEIQVAPPGSDTAKFQIGKPEYLADDGARVPCKWTDLDKEGKPRTDDITWMVRKEPEGWRIAGMAAKVFEGEEQLLLDFENPQETLRKLALLQQEIQRRAVKTPPHQGEEKAEKSPETIRR